MAQNVADASTLLSAQLARRDDLNCGSGGGADTYLGLRVASIFVILVGSMFGALFPVLSNRTPWLRVPKVLFDFAKFFGSGIIIATAFIHLLASAVSELGSPCLPASWSIYPYALALCMISVFGIFLVELIAFRVGTAKLRALGVRYDTHGHDAGSHAAHGPEGNILSVKEKGGDDHTTEVTEMDDFDAVAQVLGVAILEFGVVLHSILVGLTLAVDPNFKVLFVVLVFHQTFEGLGVGSRLAFMKLPAKYNWVPIAGAILYGVTTPVGIAAGLGVRSTYNPGSTTASVVSGVLDSLSAGILLYTGLVELLAHEFLFDKDMLFGSPWRLVYAVVTMCLGAGLMALLGRWA